jgi:1-acyl-sn-glycerol-3-phosphate acyltransferase
MAHAIQYVRSVLFIVLMYLWMAVVGLIGLPFAAASRAWAFRFVKFYCHSVVWLLKVLCRIDIEVRGALPEGDVIVVSKHQSFLDVILHLMLLPRGNFIMKRELLYTPFVGFYAKRLGVASVKRGDRAKAMKKMVADVEGGNGDGQPTQLIIYPQGTRVPPGTYKPYKVGAGVLYEKFGKPCIPAATNAGVFWPKRGLYRKPGTVVIHYLPALPAGLKLKQFMREMEDAIETESNALMREAGVEPAPRA